MPRLLPWQSGGAARSKASTPAPSTSKKRKQPILTDAEADLLDGNLNPVQGKHAKSEGKRAVRDASSSPPPISSAPPVEYMLEGKGQDDQWMMVEDEFYSTAKIYTQHIHHAEYVRKTEEAKARQERRYTSHHMNGRTQQSRSTQMSLASQAKERKIREAMKEQDGGQSDLDDADPHLAGLMTGTRAPTLDLTGFAKVQTNTRAAAGYQQSPHRDRQTKMIAAPESSAEPEADGPTDDDEDDLDRPVPRKTQTTRVLTISPKKPTVLPEVESTKTGSSANIFAHFARKKTSEEKHSILGQKSSNVQVSPTPSHVHDVKVKWESKIKQQRAQTQVESDALIKTEPSSYKSGSGYLARKRAEREKKRKAEEEALQKQIKQEEYEIPTFL